jgi:hypothetical protein
MRKFLTRGCLGLALLAAPIATTGCLSEDLLDELEDVFREIRRHGFFDDDDDDDLDDFLDDLDDFFDDLRDAFD